MDHKQYHSLRRAARLAMVERSDFGALAAVTTLGEKMYFSQDWDEWSLEERTIYGMFVALDLDYHTQDVRTTWSWQLAVEMTSAPEAIAIARMVWENFE